MKIRYELELEISGNNNAAVNEMASRGVGAGEVLRKWEDQIRNTKFGTGNASAKVVLFEEVR